MTPREIKSALLKLMDDAWIKQDLDQAYELYADEIVFHRPPFPPTIGKEANLQADAGLLAAFSDIELTVHDVFAEGDTGILHWTWSGDHTDTLPATGTPATGKHIQLSGCSIYRFRDSEIIEQWEYSDLLGFMQQLELIPAMG